MPRLRPARTPEEAAAVPSDKPVTIELTATPPLPDADAPAEPDKPTPPKPAPAAEPLPEPEPEPELATDAEADDNTLVKQLADLKAAEALVKQQLAEARSREEAALRQAQDREQELVRERGSREQAEYDSVLSAIGAAQAEADKAQNDLEAALTAQDYRVAAEAQRRLATATTRLVTLEDGKAAAEVRREESKARPAPSSDPVASAIDGMTNLSSRQRNWLKDHRDAFTDPAKNAYLGAAHWDAIRAGHAQDSEAYFVMLEEKLGYRQPPRPSPSSEPETQRKSIPMSAPVSREIPSLGGGNTTPSRVTLTAEQREAARIAGVDDVTYAKNYLRLQELKKHGHYQERG